MNYECSCFIVSSYVDILYSIKSLIMLILNLGKLSVLSLCNSYRYSWTWWIRVVFCFVLGFFFFFTEFDHFKNLTLLIFKYGTKMTLYFWQKKLDLTAATKWTCIKIITLGSTLVNGSVHASNSCCTVNRLFSYCLTFLK